MEKQNIVIPPVCLEWSDWIPWNTLKINARKSGIQVPEVAGVYEVKYADSDERLTIGKTGNLRHRIKPSLIKGHFPHSAGERIRETENVEKLLVRWAATDRPSAVEEELLRKYKMKKGKLPKYTLSVR